MPKDHVDPENAYFLHEERKKLAALKEQAQSQQAEADAAARRQAHFHKCGKCGDDMNTQLFKGVEIEICPDCCAVLLDPGELEILAGTDGSTVMNTLSDLFSFSKKKREG